jgi:hypothetical protein
MAALGRSMNRNYLAWRRRRVHRAYRTRHPAPDTTAPTTTVNLDRAAGSNGWFKSVVNVILRAFDDEDGTSVAFVEYSCLNGGQLAALHGAAMRRGRVGDKSIRGPADDRARSRRCSQRVHPPSPTAVPVLSRSGCERRRQIESSTPHGHLWASVDWAGSR